MTYEETIEWIFLSTLSLRRATGDAFYLDLVSGISIHALLAESDVFCQCKKRVGSCISIHALLAESDMARNWISTTTSRFLSTLSLRRATALDRLKSQATVISIHALLAESDRRPDRLWRAYHGNFYPRSPCGERRPDNFVRGGHFRFLSTLSLRRATGIVPIRYGFGATFLSTLSLRRATRLCQRQPRAQAISIHALLAESDFFCDF